MKEKILEAFISLGFKLEEEGAGYSFTYEGLNMLLLYNEEEDESFFTISLPGILEAHDENFMHVFALTEKINSTLKYIKAYLLQNSIWLFYERELIGEEDMPLIISRMIYRLEAAMYFARKTQAEIEAYSPDGNGDDAADNADEVRPDGFDTEDNNEE